MLAPDQELRYRIVVLLVLQPPRSMIFSSGTPLSNRSRAAPTRMECPLNRGGSRSRARCCRSTKIGTIESGWRDSPTEPSLPTERKIGPSGWGSSLSSEVVSTQANISLSVMPLERLISLYEFYKCSLCPTFVAHGFQRRSVLVDRRPLPIDRSHESP